MRDPERHVKQLGKRLDGLDAKAGEVIKHIYEHEKYSLIEKLFVAYAHQAYLHAYDSARQEVEEARRHLTRSYALPERLITPPGPDEFRMSDYYRQYLVELAGVVQQETLTKANMSLEKSEIEGEGVNAAAERLGDVLKRFAVPRLITIVRTEGTRVASAARRDLGVRAARGGLGPDWLIYTSILDDRVTHTCHVAHNHKRPLDPASPLWLEIPPPAHYNCRSMERYGFSWFEGDRNIPDWDDEALAVFRQTRLEEFPKWSPRALPPPKENLFEIAG